MLQLQLVLAVAATGRSPLAGASGRETLERSCARGEGLGRNVGA